jgi:hypothetical protein
MDISLILGGIGTATGVLSLVIPLLRFAREKPQLRIDDLFVQLSKSRGKYSAKVSFTLHTVGVGQQ